MSSLIKQFWLVFEFFTFENVLQVKYLNCIIIIIMSLFYFVVLDSVQFNE